MRLFHPSPQSLLWAIVAPMLAAPFALAQEPPAQVPEWLDRLTVDGRAYLRYSYELADTARNYNEFDIDRIYVGFRWKLWDKGAIRYTLEGGDLRENGGDQFAVTTKHLFVEVQDPFYAGTFVRAGQFDLPWVPYEEAVWGYRVQGTVFPDRSGYLTSSDMGLAAGGTFPQGYGSWQVSVINGEGWKKNESGKHKDVHARLTLNPLAAAGGSWGGAFVAGFASLGTYDGVTTGPNDRNRFIVQGGVRSTGRATLVGELLWSADPGDRLASKHPSLAARTGETAKAVGLSLFGTFNLSTLSSTDGAKRWELFGRWDWLDADRAIANNDLNRGISGVSYRWNGRVLSLLSYELVNYQSGALKPDERRLLMQAEVRY